MGYVGGLGAGRGWLKSSFLLSPEELATLLSFGRILLYTRAAVPRPFRPLPAADFVDAYRQYLEAGKAGESLTPEVGRKLSHQLSRSEDVYRERPTKFDPKGFSVLDLNQPAVGFDLAVVPLPPARKDATPPEKPYLPVGLEISFPKFVSFRDGDFELESTEGMPNRALYDEMAAWAKARTRPITLVRGTVTKRTPGRISDAMREWFEALPAMRSHRTHLR